MPTGQQVLDTPPQISSRGLPKSTEKELLQDIEFYGGIDSITLAHICDLKPNLYGVAGSSQRKKIQNKVNYWKRFDCRQYRKLLQLLKRDDESAPTHSSSATNTPVQADTSTDNTPQQANCRSPLEVSRELFSLPPASTPTMQASSSSAISALPPPGLASQSASENATYIQRALEAGDYGKFSRSALTCE